MMITTKFATLGLCAALVLVGAPAIAHPTLEVGTAVVGGTYKAVLRVPHGCDGAATTSIHVTVPEGFYNVKPMPHAGWALETVTSAYEKTYVNHGTEVAEGVTDIIWSGGDLPDEWYDEFIFRGSFATDLTADAPFYFPVVQQCGDVKVGWTNVTADTEAGKPAPNLVLTAASVHQDMAHGDMTHGATHAAPSEIIVGDLRLSGGFARAMVPTAKSGGGFVSITNVGADADRLISARSARAAKVETHEMKMEGDVMQMRHLEGGIEVPAGATIDLKPGGLHLMFLGVNTPFVEGERISVELTFENAGPIEVMLDVGGFAASAVPMTH